MMQARERSSTPDLPSLRMMAGTALGVALVNGGGLRAAWGQAADAAPVALPQVSVDGAQSGQGGYQVNLPAFGKLTQPLVSTPHSIVEVPRQLLDDQGVTTMREALRNVPGVSLAAGEGGQQGDNLSIRGFNAQNDFYLDGVRDFGSYYRDPFNLQSIEVLQGPASTLFGRGSSGGAVNQVSKQPQIAPITQGSIGIGTDGTYRFTSDVNRAIDGIEGAAIRLNVMGDLNGTAGRPAAENRRFGFAPEIAFGLGTPTRFTLDFYHQQAYDTPDYGIPWLNGRPAPVSSKSFYGYADKDYFRTNVNIVTSKVEHDVNDRVTISDQFRYGSYRRDIRVTEPLILNQGPGQDFVRAGTPLSAIVVSRNLIARGSEETILDNQLNATIRVNTGPLAHAIVLGFEVARQTSDPTRPTYPRPTTTLLGPNYDAPFTVAGTPTTISSTTVDNVGMYAVDTIALSPQWDLLGGIRFDQFDSTYRQPLPAIAPLIRNDGLASYSAALVYKPATNASVYARFGTSFNPSAESLSLSAATATVAPEKTKTYEIGGKWDVLSERLSLTGAVYQIRKANVRETDPNDATRDILAGNYRVRGFQFGATGHLTDRWEIFTGYSYNDANVVASPNKLEVGNVPPNAPHHTASLFTTYRLPWRDLELGGGLNYVSSRTASSTPVAGTNTVERAPGYFTLSLMAKYPINEHMSVQANVANVTDRYYYDELHPGHIILGPARSALFTLNVKL
jgi:catecholate siderophore receptor